MNASAVSLPFNELVTCLKEAEADSSVLEGFRRSAALSQSALRDLYAFCLYKELHDTMHRLALSDIRGISTLRTVVDRVTNTRLIVRQYYNTARDCLRSVERDLVIDSEDCSSLGWAKGEVADEADDLLREFREALDRCVVALENTDEDELWAAIGTVRRATNNAMASFDSGITRHERRFSEGFRQVFRITGDESALAEGQSPLMQKAKTLFERDSVTFHSLVAKHQMWQRTEIELCRVEDFIDFRRFGTEEFSAKVFRDQWLSIFEKLMEVVDSERGEVWAGDLLLALIDVDKSIEDPAGVVGTFLVCRGAFRTVFFEKDRSLLSCVEELRVLGKEMANFAA